MLLPFSMRIINFLSPLKLNRSGFALLLSTLSADEINFERDSKFEIHSS